MRHKYYDDDLLVDLIARRGLTYREIGERIGIGSSLVTDIIAGKCRKELLEPIERARAALAPQQRRPRRQAPTDGPPTSGIICAEYDDQLLVRLIADPNVPTTRVAREVGISTSMVAGIARGKFRPDLQPRIDKQLRSNLLEQRRLAAGADLTGDEQSVSHRRIGYDDELLIELLGRGDLSLAQVGRRVGLSGEHVRRIFRGRSRPALQPRIRAAVKNHTAYVRAAARRTLEAMVNKHINTGLNGDDELARKCREFIMKMVWSDDKDADDAPRELPRPGLTNEDYQAIARLKGGPVDDEPQNGGTGSQGPGTSEGNGSDERQQLSAQSTQPVTTKMTIEDARSQRTADDENCKRRSLEQGTGNK